MHTHAHTHTYEHTHAQKFMQFYSWIYCTIDLKDFTTQKWYNVDTCTYDKYLYQIPDNAWQVSQLRVKCTGMKILNNLYRFSCWCASAKQLQDSVQ